MRRYGPRYGFVDARVPALEGSLELGQVGALVEQRPQGAVGITVVIFLDILLRQVDRARGDAAIGLEMEIMPRADVARPAAPDAVAFPERRGERDGKPTLRNGLFGLGGGNPVRDDAQAAQRMVLQGLLTRPAPLNMPHK